MTIASTTSASDNLPPIKSKGFSFSSATGLTCQTHQRATSEQLSAFFHPIPLGRGSRKNHQLQPPGSKTKQWYLAQLKYYEIPHKSSSTVTTLRDILSAAVDAGTQCNELPPTVATIAADLEAQYTAANNAHLSALDAERYAHFSQIPHSDPTAAAQYNLKLFLHRYFLDDAGQLDQAKAVLALALPGFVDRAVIHDLANKMTGLHSVSGGGGDFGSSALDRVVVIGCNRDKVWAEASKIGNAGRQRQEAERDVGRDEMMEKHRAFVEKQGKEKKEKEKEKKKKKKKKKNGGGGGDGDGDDPKGTYFVKCEEIESNWPDKCDEDDGLKLVICDDSERVNKHSNRSCLMADFEFGVLEGMMRFWADGEDPVADYEQDSEDDNSEDHNTNNSDDDDDDGVSPPPPLSKKRSHHTLTTTKATKATKTAKKSRQTRPNTNLLKFHFFWRGCETGEGEIEVDYDGSNKGYIEFTDNTFTAFNGVWQASLLGENCKFFGYKIGAGDDDGCRSGQNRWSDFGERAYEYARVSRWR